MIVVGVGGGLIKPMQSRWDSCLDEVEEEAPRMHAEAERAPSVGQQAKAITRRVQQFGSRGGSSSQQAR